STQMTASSPLAAELLRTLGLSRVVVPRELSVDEIRAYAAGTSLPLEVFIHGALCVAWSGQCFSSEAWGGRSANRGQCAQACRLPYELFVDGRLRPLADARYLLSPGDLYALAEVPEIVEMGVAALKIEGRYKDAEYVALTTPTMPRSKPAMASYSMRPIGAARRSPKRAGAFTKSFRDEMGTWRLSSVTAPSASDAFARVIWSGERTTRIWSK